ncbi:hypothetical protein CHUAL_003713 [Chamberlinius hualienensis]
MESKNNKVESPMLSDSKATGLNEAQFTPVPADRLNIVFSIFYLLGLGTLLPWNFFITAQGYWSYKFRDVSADHGAVSMSNSTLFQNNSGLLANETFSSNSTDSSGSSAHLTDLQRTFTSYLSVASMVPNTIFLMLNTILSRRIPQKIRLVVSLVLVIALFIVTVVMVKVDTDSWQKQFFAFTLFTVVLINMNTAIFQGALFGLGGVFPVQITQAIMNGQALGGIFASVANILSIIGGSSAVDSAFGYFIAAVVTLIISVIAYINLPKFVRHLIYIYPCKGIEMSSISNRSKNVPFWHIFLKIKVYAISVCLVFTVTLSVFPAVTAMVKSSNNDNDSDWNQKFFLPVGCFLMFNVGDYTGRMLAGWFHLPNSRIPLILILTLLRAVFIPLFLFSNTDNKYFTVLMFDHDAYYLLFMIAFSVSGGYLASQAMIHGPKEAEMEHQEAAGSMMAFFLGLGLMLGAALSNGFVRLI